MTKGKLFLWIQWLIAVAAYAYLGYSLATYSHYDIVADSLRAMGGLQWAALGLCIALMPLNMWLEAWRWRTLMQGEGLSFREAQRQVYYSKLAGVITPWRLGEYPARGVLMVNEGNAAEGIMARVLSAGAIGSVTMTAAIVLLGALALVCLPAVYSAVGTGYMWTLIAAVLIIAVALVLAPRTLKRWTAVSKRLIAVSMAQSVARLLCWCVQLALVLLALKGLEMSDLSVLSVWLQLPVYYLLVTITPNIPIVEAGVRGAWAMLLFGTVNAALAGVTLWAINTLLPCLVGAVITSTNYSPDKHSQP